MGDLLSRPAGNPSSVHCFGRDSRDLIETARERVARLMGAHADEVFFTSGGTESNNIFLTGCPDADRPLWITPFEHPSVLEPCREQWAASRPGGLLPGNGDGQASIPAGVEDAWASVQWVNNETGVIQPLTELSRTLHAQGAIVHTDGAQGFFRNSATVDELGVDAATLTAHKSFGPVGVGVLYLRRGTILDPVYRGGPQERSLRPGTENLLAIHGLGVLASVARDEELWPLQQLRTLRERLLDSIRAIAGLSVLTPLDHSFPNVISCSVEDLDSDTMLFRLDRVGVAASSGSACSAGTGVPSSVLKAMGVEDARLSGAIRFSFTPATSGEELDQAGAAFRGVVEGLRRERAGSS